MVVAARHLRRRLRAHRLRHRLPRTHPVRLHPFHQPESLGVGPTVRGPRRRHAAAAARHRGRLLPLRLLRRAAAAALAAAVARTRRTRHLERGAALAGGARAAAAAAAVGVAAAAAARRGERGARQVGLLVREVARARAHPGTERVDDVRLICHVGRHRGAPPDGGRRLRRRVLRGAVGDEHGRLAAASLGLVLAERPLEVELVPVEEDGTSE